MKIKTGDTVKVLSGKDRGKRGRVMRALPKERRVIVEGLNIKKRHRRSRRQDRKGEVVLLPAPMSVSAVELVCPHCGRPTRIGSRLAADGTKTRMCKQCGQAL